MALGIGVQEKFVQGPLIPAGEHDVVLASVVKKRIKSQFSDSDDGKEDKFIFSFKTKVKYNDEETGEKKPYEYSVFTRTKYGNEKAALTLLLDQLIPDMDEAQAGELDLEDLIGTKYKTLIRHTKDKENPTKKWANAVYFTPATGRPAPVVPAPVEEEVTQEADPFADDE